MTAHTELLATKFQSVELQHTLFNFWPITNSRQTTPKPYITRPADQLQRAVERNEYGEAAHLIEAVQQLAGHFQSFVAIPKVAELSGRVATLQRAVQVPSGWSDRVLTLAFCIPILDNLESGSILLGAASRRFAIAHELNGCLWHCWLAQQTWKSLKTADVPCAPECLQGKLTYM